MTVKECSHHEEEGRQLIHRIIAGVVAFVVLVLIVIFFVWIVLRPSKPSFLLQDATVYVFNLSSSPLSPATPIPNTLTTTMQVTLSSHNPNDRIGIYYQKADVFVSYRGEQITLATELPSTYQGHKDVAIWSPFLYGSTVPVSPYLLNSLQQDQNAGGVLVNVKVSGRVKWKVGTWVSGRYHLDVNCPAYIRLANDHNNNGIGFAGPALKFQLLQACTVDV